MAGFIFENTVLRYANAVETCAQRAQPPDNHSILQASNDCQNEWTCYNKRANSGDKEERRPEQNAPRHTPEGASLTPHFDPFTCIVVSPDYIVAEILQE
jgi:hypothetical protein